MLTTKELIHEVISLPVEERAVVADTLLRSLNPPEEKIDTQWMALVKRRLAELRSGAVIPIPGDEVFTKIWKRFGV